MTSLAAILRERDKILMLIMRFGFVNPKIFRRKNKFNLLVTDPTDTAFSTIPDRHTLLGVKLLQIFNYDCALTVGSQSSVANEVLEKAVDFNQDEAIQRVFGQDMNAVEFEKPILSDQDKYYVRDMLSLADTISDAIQASNCIHQKLTTLQVKKIITEHELKVMARVYGANSLVVANLLENSVPTYSQLGEIETVKTNLERALTIKENLYGKEHQVLAIILTKIAIVYDALKTSHPLAQQELLERALAIYEKHYADQDQVEMVPTLLNLADIYSGLTDMDKTKRLLLRALPLQEIVTGKESKDVAETLLKLADLEVAPENLQQRINLLQDVLPIYEKLHGDDSLEVATILKKLIEAHGLIDEFELQIQKALLERTLDIEQTHLGLENSETACTLATLAMFYYCKLNDKYNALQIMRKAYSLLLFSLGEKDSNVINAQNLQQQWESEINLENTANRIEPVRMRP